MSDEHFASMRQARQAAFDFAQVPRESKGGEPIKAHELNDSSRGQSWNEMRVNDSDLGRRYPPGGQEVFHHPDGHPDAGAAGSPAHHDLGHFHAKNRAGEERVYTYDQKGGLEVQPMIIPGLFGHEGASRGELEVFVQECQHVSEAKLRQLFVEISYGFFVCGTLPCLSLRHQESKRLRIVDLHPVFQDTLVGHVLLELDMLMKTKDGVFINLRKRTELANKLREMSFPPMDAVFPSESLLLGKTEEDLEQDFGYFHMHRLGVDREAPLGRTWTGFKTDADFTKELEPGSAGLLGGDGRSAIVLKAKVTSVCTGSGYTLEKGVSVETAWRPELHFPYGDYLLLGDLDRVAGKSALEQYEELLEQKGIENKCRSRLLSDLQQREASTRPIMETILTTAGSLDPDTHLEPALLEMLHAITFFSAFVCSMHAQLPNSIPDLLKEYLEVTSTSVSSCCGRAPFSVRVDPYPAFATSQPPLDIWHTYTGGKPVFRFCGGCVPLETTGACDVHHAPNPAVPVMPKPGFRIAWGPVSTGIRRRMEREFSTYAKADAEFQEAMCLVYGRWSGFAGPRERPPRSSDNACAAMLKRTFPDGFCDRRCKSVAQLAREHLGRESVAHLLESDSTVPPAEWEDSEPVFFPCGGTGIPRWFRGRWCCNKQHGPGSWRFGDTGRWADGEYEFGVPHGKWVYGWPDGDKWELRMEHGRVAEAKLVTGSCRQWHGHLNLFLGRIYIGQLDENGTASGPGAFIYSSGDVVIAVFDAGKAVPGTEQRFETMPPEYAKLLDGCPDRHTPHVNDWLEQGHRRGERVGRLNPKRQEQLLVSL